MALDPEISLHAGQGAGQVSPFDTLGKVIQLRQGMNQIQLFQNQMAARQRLGEIATQSVDDQGNFSPDMFFNNASRDPIAGPYAGEQLNQMRQAQLSKIQYDAKRTELMNSAWQGLNKTLATVQDPSLVGPALSGWIASQPDFVRQQIAGPAGDLMRSLTVMPDGSQAPPQVLRARLGQLGVAGGMDATAYNNTFGTQGTQQTAGPNGINQTVAGVNLPAGQGGGFMPAGETTPHTVLPQGVSPEVGNALTPTVSGGVGPRASVAPIMTSQGLASGSEALPGNQAASPSSLAYQADRAKDMAGYQQKVDQTVTDWSNIMRTTQEAQKALQDFKPGGGAGVYAHAAQLAQAVGAPQSLVDRLGNGDISAGQEFQKLMVDSTMSRIRVALEGIGGSRINQQEFEHFQQNNPNIDTDPRAIDKIFKFWQRQYNISRDEQSGMNQYISQHGNLSEWPQKWQDTLQNKYGVGEDDAVAATSGMLNPKAPAAATLPDSAKSALQEGHVTTFKNGQKWTLKNGQAVQVTQ